MNESEFNELRETSWRRKLMPAEELRAQAHLAAHPEAQTAWEEDLALTRQLQDLPNAPLSSNFTSLVLQAVDAQKNQPASIGSLASWWNEWLRRFAPRVALATLTVALGVGGIFEYRAYTRKQVVQGVKQFLASLPGPVPEAEFAEDFEAIQQLQTVSFSKDDDLLAALK